MYTIFGNDRKLYNINKDGYYEILSSDDIKIKQIACAWDYFIILKESEELFIFKDDKLSLLSLMTKIHD